MRLTFLGTRANTKVSSRLHRRHSALMVETGHGRVVFDCGRDWVGRMLTLAPDAIFVTHAHPDHADGLRDGAPCPIYATADSWELMADFALTDRRLVIPGRPTMLCGLAIDACPVAHALLAPAVGYRVAGDGAALFYAPDVLAIVHPAAALEGVSLYIGDGASPTRPIVRRRDGVPFGHAPIRDQIGWCAAAGVPRAIFTHCGAQIISAGERAATAQVKRMGAAKGVRTQLARDGLQLDFP
jgi:phosphoribosyl 1,2-cyclic phosphodiesterase